jgi:segregation and condensation protein B
VADFDETDEQETGAREASAAGEAGGGAPADGEAEPGRPADAQTPDELKAVIEALIFASPEPLTPKALYKLLASEPSEDVKAALDLLVQDYDRPGGLHIVQVAGGYQIVTRPEFHEWVRRLFHERTTQKLSVQALETLSVIAYKQPITAAEIAEIRGVNTSGVLNTLIERQLIKISGRKQVVGRPFLYSTTREFLIRFGLKDLSDLPNIQDMSDVLGFEPPPGLVDARAEGDAWGQPESGAATGSDVSDADRGDETSDRQTGRDDSPGDENEDADEDEFEDEDPDPDLDSDDPEDEEDERDE